MGLATMSDELPAVVSESSFRLFGVDVRCYVLDNGQRIINADDFHAMMRAMGAGVFADPNDIAAFTKWRMGR
jgi:hypothetical protein